MKKLLFIDGPLGGGGAERVLIDILRNFDYSRYDIDLALIYAGGILLDEVPNDVNVISLWNGYSLSYKLALRFSNWFGIDCFLKNHIRGKVAKRYDAVISFIEGIPFKLQHIAKIPGKQYSWVHCDLLNFQYEKSQFRKDEEERSYRELDGIICVSRDASNAFCKRFQNIEIKRVLTIYNPIDKVKILAMANTFSIQNDVFTIVTVGRLTPPKKMDRVIRIASFCKKEGLNVKFQIIGEGELHNELLRQRDEYGVNDMVEFLGFKKNPYPYIRAADLMFCCSGYEGFCLVICEAMILGVPVVSTRTAGPMEILGNNEYGLLTGHDDDAMFNGVKLLICNAYLRAEYKQKGFDRSKLFGVEKTMNDIYKLF